MGPCSIGQKEEETRIFHVISVYCRVYCVAFDVQYLEELAHAVLMIGFQHILVACSLRGKEE